VAIYSIGRRRLIVLLLLTSLLLLTLDTRGNRVLDSARSGFVAALGPVETAADVVTQPFVNAWRGVTEYDDFRAENQDLRDQLAAQRADQVTARAAIAELEELRNQLDIDSLNDLPKVTAQVVGARPDNLDQVVEINKGASDNIEVGMAVIANGGLIGKVTRVFSDRAQVMLVTDDDYTVAVQVLASTAAEAGADEVPTGATTPSGAALSDLTSTTTTLASTLPSGPVPGPTTTAAATTTTTTTTTLIGPDGSVITAAPTTTLEPPAPIARDTGRLEGRGGNRLPQVDLLSGEFRLGDPVVTAGGSESLAPPGIPVGVVRNVVRRPGTLGTLLEVELSADIERLGYVTIVLYKPRSEVGG
jgi:rod shape-determining protein MreC